MVYSSVKEVIAEPSQSALKNRLARQSDRRRREFLDFMNELVALYPGKELQRGSGQSEDP